VFDSVRSGFRLLPLLARKPALALRWLGAAHAGLIVLLVVGLAVPLGLPAVLEPVLADLYPPVRSSRHLIGPISLPTLREDPRRQERLEQLTAMAWCVGLGAVALLLLSAAPSALVRAASESLDRERRGDSFLPHEPTEGLRAYRSALALASDPAREASLREKIRRAESSLGCGASPGSSAAGSAAPPAHPAATAIEPVLPPSGHAADTALARRYRPGRELGRGGMGVVYVAVDTVLDRPVALKELPLHLGGRSELARRFRQEARLLARLSHPNIVQIHDLIEDGPHLLIAMELVEGGTLADAIEARGRLAWPEVVRLGTGVATGLAFAHARGVIHRDVKPANVLLASDGLVPKLTDFGLARSVHASSHTLDGSLLGSARYMSPEQASGRRADERSDIYALGVTFYEMLSGRAPFEGEVAALLAQHLSGAPPRLGSLVSGLPPALEAMVMAMLEKDPDGRPDSVDAILDTLGALKQPSPGTDEPRGR
jgi:hypothetical protein